MNKEESKKKNTKHTSLPHYMTSTSKRTNVVGVIKIASIDYKENKPKPPLATPPKPPVHESPSSAQKPNSTPNTYRPRPKSLNLSSTTPIPKSNVKTPKGNINPNNITQSTKHPSVHVTSFKDPKLKKETVITPTKTPKSVKTPKTKHMSMSFDAASLQKAREYEEKYGKSMVEPSPKSDQTNNKEKHRHHSNSNISNNSGNNNRDNNNDSSCSSSSSSHQFKQHSHHHHHHHHHHNSPDYISDETPPPPIDDIFEYSLPAFTIPSKIPKINLSSSSSGSSSITSSNNTTSSSYSNNKSDSEIKYFSVPSLIDTPPTMLPDDLMDVPTLPPPPKYNMSESYCLPPPSLSQKQQSQPKLFKPPQQEEEQQLLQQQESYYDASLLSQQQQLSNQYNEGEYIEVGNIKKEKTERELYEELRNEIYNNNNNNSNNKIKSKKSSDITEDYRYYIPQIITLQRWYRELRKRHQDFYNEINRQPFALDGDHSYEDKNEKLKNETFSPSADDEFFSAFNEGIVF